MLQAGGWRSVGLGTATRSAAFTRSLATVPPAHAPVIARVEEAVHAPISDVSNPNNAPPAIGFTPDEQWKAQTPPPRCASLGTREGRWVRWQLPAWRHCPSPQQLPRESEGEELHSQTTELPPCPPADSLEEGPDSIPQLRRRGAKAGLGLAGLAGLGEVGGLGMLICHRSEPGSSAPPSRGEYLELAS